MRKQNNGHFFFGMALVLFTLLTCLQQDVAGTQTSCTIAALLLNYVFITSTVAQSLNEDNDLPRMSEPVSCPERCTCQLVHWIDLPATRIIANLKRKIHDVEHTEMHMSQEESNDVFDASQDLEDDPLGNGNPIMRLATCMLPNQNATDFLSNTNLLSTDYDGLTLIEPVESNNSELHSSNLVRFDKLTSLEVDGLGHAFPRPEQGVMLYVLDTPLRQLEHLSLNNLGLRRGSAVSNQISGQESNDILPYDVYMMSEKDKSKSPTFTGHDSLITLQLRSCNLQQINWQMFDKLTNLLHLNLDDNYLKFIPDFAFYGTPKLKTLSLSRNNLLSIQVTDLAGLLELEYIDLSHNSFTQLSELSLPPFPQMRLADFQNNPITTIYPHTFDIMNTTEGLEIGCSNQQDFEETPSDCSGLQLLPNSFRGLSRLKRLTIRKARATLLTADMFAGLTNLVRLTINSGKINAIEYDAFAAVKQLIRLTLTGCHLSIISMDAFVGLQQLEVLDLSNNDIEMLPPGVFDQLNSLTELYLQKNKLQTLPFGMFLSIANAKLVRLNDNPWECACGMSEWDANIVNTVKKWGSGVQSERCQFNIDKGHDCGLTDPMTYSYDNRVAPKCTTPKKYINMGVFQVLRKYLPCKPIKVINKTEVMETIEKRVLVTAPKDNVLIVKEVVAQQTIDNQIPVQSNYISIDTDIPIKNDYILMEKEASEKQAIPFKKSQYKKYTHNTKILDKLRKLHQNKKIQ